MPPWHSGAAPHPVAVIIAKFVADSAAASDGKICDTVNHETSLEIHPDRVALPCRQRSQSSRADTAVNCKNSRCTGDKRRNAESAALVSHRIRWQSRWLRIADNNSDEQFGPQFQRFVRVRSPRPGYSSETPTIWHRSLRIGSSGNDRNTRRNSSKLVSASHRRRRCSD